MYWSNEEVLDKYIFKYSLCKDPISEDERKKIISDLADDMPGMKVREYFENQAKIFNSYEHMVCAVERSSNKFIGVFGSKWYEDYSTPFLYLWTAFIVKRYQSSLLFPEMVSKHINHIKETKYLPKLIVLKSYHPTVYKTLTLFEKIPGVTLYPKLDIDNNNHPLSLEANEIAKFIAPNAELDKKTGALVNGMGTAGIKFYSSRPVCSQNQINDYFTNALDAYDQMMCILKFENDDILDKALKIVKNFCI